MITVQINSKDDTKLQLRPYQQSMVDDINAVWTVVNNVLAVAPTGSGKTVVFGNVISNHVGSSCAIAHRQELVGQISLALAQYGVHHKIIAPKALIYDIVQSHMDEVGASFYNPSSTVAVAGVDTLIRRVDKMADWFKSVTLWVTDECHHIVNGNKWGTACELFPNAKGLGVTATPCRTDGAGLGRHADGVFDSMIIGPEMRDLITQGYLTDYRIFAPPSDLDLEGVRVSKKTGEYSPVQLKDRVEESHILGDVVEHYQRLASGKLGVTFAVDVGTATDIARRYNEAGIPAMVVHAKTPTRERRAILKRFKRRELLQLVNVDLFGEGFDLPAIEVVSMARPTQSYGLFVQQFGRALRPMDGKDWAIIIDHVGNIKRHGLPDAPRTWTLNRRERATRNKHDPDKIPLKTCKSCTGLYEAFFTICPYCGAEDVPAERSTIRQVDGDLMELDPNILAQMRGEIDKPVSIPYGATVPVELRLKRLHGERAKAQQQLRRSIEWYGGFHAMLGIDRSESWKRFYFRFNIDVLGAQALNTKEATELDGRIVEFLNSRGIRWTT